MAFPCLQIALLPVITSFLITCRGVDIFDLNYPVIKSAPKSATSTLFGYSLAFFSRNSESSEECSGSTRCHEMLIGAPLDNQFEQNSGAFYSCPVNSYTDDCSFVHTYEIREDLSQPVFVPQRGGKSSINPNYLWSFENAWLGSSISTPEVDVGLKPEETLEDFAVVCANQFSFLSNSRYMNTKASLLHEIKNASYFTGMCLKFDDNLDLVPINDEFDRRFPCPIISSDSSNNVGCQTGFSSDMRQFRSEGSQSTTRQFLYGAPITGQWYDGLPIMQEEVSYDSMPENPDFYSRPTVVLNRYEETATATTNFKVSSSVNIAPLSHPLLSSQGGMTTADGMHKMQYLAGAPMFGKGAVFVEEDSAPDDTNSPQILQQILSAKMGQGFGRAVLAIDLTGDGFSEVIVGAPDFFEYRTHGGAVYIYSHNNTVMDGFREEPFMTLKGKPYSQFGHAVSSLGDVNYDGCMDFAVGAPNERHEEEDGSAGGSESTGAVYIYLGSRDWGLMDTKQPSQILYAKQFERHSPSGAIHRFGYSFARPRDLDMNGFPDLGVGAPGLEPNVFRPGLSEGSAGLVIAIRMRPLVHITASLIAYEYDPNSMPSDLKRLNFVDILSGNPDKCGMTKTNAGEEVAFCFYLQICFAYHSSENIPKNEELGTIYVDAHIALDSDFEPQKPRAEFASRQNTISPSDMSFSRVKLTYPEGKTQGRPICQPLQQVLVVSANNRVNRDASQAGEQKSPSDPASDSAFGSAFKPLLIAMNYSLSDQNEGGSISTGSDKMAPQGGQLIDLDSFPVLNASLSHMEIAAQQMSMDTLLIQFAKDCGTDQTCISRAQLDVKFEENVLKETQNDVTTNYVYLDTEFIININIAITGEPSYEPGILIQFPPYIWFDSVYPECKYTPDEGQIRCTFANKVDGGDSIKKRFTFMSKQESAEFIKKEPLNTLFKFKFLTTSNLTDDSTIGRNLSLTVYQEADLRLSGAGSPQTVIYGGNIRGAFSIKEAGDVRSIGQQLTHSYEVYNYGLSDIPTVDLQILWPEKFRNGKYLLYVTEKPQVTDSQGNIYPSSKYLCSNANFEIDPFNIASAKRAETNVNRRVRRADNEPPSEKSIVSQPSKMQIDCFNKMAICTKYSCTFNGLNSKSGVKVSIPSRIWNSTFAEDMPDSVDVLSHAETKIINAKYLHQEQETNDISNIRTRVVKDPKLMKEQRIPIWIIILAIVGGLLLLLIIILICAKLGFFRRKRQVNRANHYRPPPQQTFQLDDMGDFDYKHDLEPTPAPAPTRTMYSGGGSFTVGYADDKNSKKQSKKKSKKGQQPQSQNMTEPYTGGYWGDVSNI